MGRFCLFSDTHCHLLPGLDDGPGHWGESIDMARCAVADGIGVVVATPHQLGVYSENSSDCIRRAAGQLRRFLEAEGIAMRVFPGAEVRLEPDLIHRIRRRETMTLADRGRHVLVELPHEVYVPFENTLDQLRRAGLVAVLAHPERNSGVRRKPEVLRSLVNRGCLLQITAGSLLGKFGGEIQQLAEQLIGNGLVQLVATDAHSVRGRRPVLAGAYQKITRCWGEATAVSLCVDNPNRIVEGKDTVPVRPDVHRSFWGLWFRRRAG